MVQQPSGNFITRFARPSRSGLFSGWYQLITAPGISNPYTELTLLRLLLGLMMFVVFSGVTILHLKKCAPKILYTAPGDPEFFLLSSISKCQSSGACRPCFSGRWSGMITKKTVSRVLPSGLDRFPLLLGVLFTPGGILPGWIRIWLIWVTKKPRHILPMAIGFIAGAALNTRLDYLFFPLVGKSHLPLLLHQHQQTGRVMFG